MSKDKKKSLLKLAILPTIKPIEKLMEEFEENVSGKKKEKPVKKEDKKKSGKVS